MGIDDSGEHSQNTNSDGERPFKKAKYAWQVKGRSHLKEKNINKPTTQTENIAAEIKPETNTTNESSKRCRGCAQNNYLNTILNHSEYIMSTSDEDVSKTASSQQIPISMVPKTKKTYDQYLAIWQADQLAKCFLDNTINTTFEKWMIAPFDDANDLIENCENGGIVEDEGILMAIQSHGLQSSSSIPLHNTDETLNYSDNCEIRNADIPECTCNPEKRVTKQPELHRNNEDLNINTTAIHQPITTMEPSINVEHLDFLSTAVAVAIQKKGLNI